MTKIKIIIQIILILFTAPVLADTLSIQDKPNPAADTTLLSPDWIPIKTKDIIVSDAPDSVKGDTIMLDVNTDGFYLLQKNNIWRYETCAPAGAHITIASDKIEDGVEYYYIMFTDLPSKSSNALPNPNVTCPIQKGELYKIAKTRMLNYPYHEDGWTFGALLVPFKFHKSDHSIEGSSTVGPYLGYKTSFLGRTVTYVGSLGLSFNNVATTQSQNQTPSTDSKTGLTAAFGILFDIKDGAFQSGIVIGKDYVSDTNDIPYKYNNTYWISMQLGFKFKN